MYFDSYPELYAVLDNGSSGSNPFSYSLSKTTTGGTITADERVTAFPAVAGDIVFFTTTMLKAACSLPDANLYAFTFLGGPAYDSGTDDRITSADTPLVSDNVVPIGSALFRVQPKNIVVLPVLFEGETKAVIELSSLGAFTPTEGAVFCFRYRLEGRRSALEMEAWRRGVDRYGTDQFRFVVTVPGRARALVPFLQAAPCLTVRNLVTEKAHMAGRIIIERLEFRVRCGVTAEERARPQPLAIDVELDCALEAAGQSDNLVHTVDYAKVARRVVEVGTTRDFRLLEAMAERIVSQKPKGEEQRPSDDGR